MADLKSAAEAGDAKAQTRLADMYAGLEEPKEALLWYRKAAAQGEARAQWQLGRTYEFGTGEIDADPDAALSWYRKAAVQDDPNAQFDLGQIYEKGTMAPTDYVEAYKWYALAARKQSVLAQASVTRLSQKMTPAALETAQKAVTDFAPQSPKPKEQIAHLPVIPPMPSSSPISPPFCIPPATDVPCPAPSLASLTPVGAPSAHEEGKTVSPLPQPLPRSSTGEKAVVTRETGSTNVSLIPPGKPSLSVTNVSSSAPTPRPALVVNAAPHLPSSASTNRPASTNLASPASAPLPGTHPSTNRAAISQAPAVVRTVDPVVASKLHLKGVSVFGSRRGATINSRTLLKGETAAFSFDNQIIQVRCLEVTDVSALVEVLGNGPLELKLGR